MVSFKPCILTVIKGNVSSLADKVDKPREYREYCVSQKRGYMRSYQTSNASIPDFHTV